MKRAIINTLIFAVAIPSLFAAVKLDGPAAQRLSSSLNVSMPASRSGEVRALPAPDASEKAIYAVEMATDADAQALAYRYNVEAVRANIALVSLDAHELQELAGLDETVQISLGYELQPLLNDARANTGVDAIHSGTGLEQAYTGNNVVVGMMDSGLDINHSNFCKDGNPRAEHVWVITGDGAVQDLNDEYKIKSFTTDTRTSTHGTHVLGIIAGGFRGRATKVASINPRTGKNQYIAGNNIYYGVAPDAILAPCCGTLRNNNSNLAAERVANYAKSKGMPVVMNYSLGHNVGPHDGSTASNKFIAEMGKEMIICISAGNEGEEPISFHHDFTSTSKEAKVCVSSGPSATGALDIWGGDSSTLKFTFVALNKSTGEVLYSYKVDKPIDSPIYITGSYYTAPGYIHDTKFDNCFGTQGAVIISSNVNAANNRYNVNINIQTQAGTAGNDVVSGYIIEGEPGNCVDFYTASCSIMSNGIAGYSDGNSNQSISDFACADNIISVGAYVNVLQWPSSDGIFGYNNVPVEVGDIAPFSSFGKKFGGEQLPFICGPGMGVRSSFSSYYLKDNPKDLQGISAYYAHDNREDYWLEMSGTSMSSPFVAGVCALWLEACPTLTVDEVKAVMKETADHDKYTERNTERWGVGKINALAGLKKILDLNSVGNVVAESKIIISREGDAYNIFAPTGNICAELVNMAGAVVARQAASGNELSFDLPTAQKGVYVLRVNAGNETASRKIVL